MARPIFGLLSGNVESPNDKPVAIHIRPVISVLSVDIVIVARSLSGDISFDS